MGTQTDGNDDGRPAGRRRAPMPTVAPARSDGLLRGFNELIGGPPGRHSAPGVVDPGFFTVERVLLLLTTAAALFAVLIKTPCRVTGWASPGSFYMACYSDWAPLYGGRGFADGFFAAFAPGSQFEYPVLMGLVASAAALLVPGAEIVGNRAVAYFDINAVLVSVLWLTTVIATARMAHRRPWDAALVALAPGIILAGFINWDMWAVVLLALAMLAFARRRPLLAGILIGLGTAMKLYPVLILGALLVLAVRTGRWKPFLLALAGTAGAWLAVNLPVMAANFGSWAYFFTFTRDRPAGFSSLWHAYNVTAGRLGWTPLTPEFINTWAFLLFVLGCAGVAYLGLAAPYRPRLAQLTFLIVAAFILSNKVYSPQFVVWLIPLVALAHPKWRDFLIWQFFEAMHWWAVWMYIGRIQSEGKREHNIDDSYYVLAVLAHILATLYIAAQVIRSIRHPEFDPVRRAGVDDPQGGPYDRAPDRWPLQRILALLDPRPERTRG